jgi:hypothetical protein
VCPDTLRKHVVPSPTTTLTVDEINLASFDFWLRDDVHGALARLRREQPVAWHQHRDSGKGFWSLTRYEDVAATTRDWETFSSAYGIRAMTDPEDSQMLSAVRSGSPKSSARTSSTASSGCPRPSSLWADRAGPGARRPTRCRGRSPTHRAAPWPGRPVVFFAGLPGTGKSLLVHQLAHLASRNGGTVHLLQWDVARFVFETSPAGRRYPLAEGVTHPTPPAGAVRRSPAGRARDVEVRSAVAALV